MDEILKAIESLTEEARISGEMPDAVTNYRAAHAALLASISTYAAQVRMREREWIALYLEGRARDVAVDNTNAAQWMARIFRDEAAAIRGDGIVAIAERALEEARTEERERIKQIVNEVARSYSPANAVDEETGDFLTGAQSCVHRILAAIPPPAQK